HHCEFAVSLLTVLLYIVLLFQSSTLFPYTTLFRSAKRPAQVKAVISGAPHKYCNAMISPAPAHALPPWLAARSPSSRTNGSQPSAAVLFGHINALTSRPPNA